ncbi:MAG TPA: hypothetical protein VMK13_12325, partial [Streptosporangiaceae bacterium]|nr:hypothetical protein [Streptosporangiaceae bacterium]
MASTSLIRWSRGGKPLADWIRQDPSMREVGVDCPAPAQPGEQMLAARAGSGDGTAGQAGRRVAGHPEVALRQHAPG